MHCKICLKTCIFSLKTAAMRNAINCSIKHIEDHTTSDQEHANESELERCHPHCEAWWWQYHAVKMRLCIRPRRACEVDGWNKCSKTQGNPEEKKLMESARHLRLGRFVIQQDNDPKHKASATQGWLKNNNVNILEWPNPPSRSQANWEFMSGLGKKACPLMISMQPVKSRIVLQRRIGENNNGQMCNQRGAVYIQTRGDSGVVHANRLNSDIKKGLRSAPKCPVKAPYP